MAMPLSASQPGDRAPLLISVSWLPRPTGTTGGSPSDARSLPGSCGQPLAARADRSLLLNPDYPWAVMTAADAPPTPDDLPSTWLGDPDLAQALDGDGPAYLAIESRRGPHVTPQAVVARDGRLWLATPHDSLKAKVLRKRPRVGLLVSG